MSFVRPTGLAGLMLTCVLSALPGNARAFELSGAWSTAAEACNSVFATKDGQVVFTELSDLYGSGFVVNSDRIQGKAVKCTIDSTKQDGNRVQLSAACATTIMTQNVKFNLTFIDDNTIDRTVEEVPGMNIKYFRCKL